MVTNESQPGQRIDLTRQVAGIDRRTRQPALVEQVPGRPPQRIVPGRHRHVDLPAGDTPVVPQGVSHKVTTREPGQLLRITPGPNGGARVIPQREAQP